MKSKDELLSHLLEQNVSTNNKDISETQKQVFAFQMECLKLEIDIIDRNMSRRETMTQGVKNFTIVSWATLITVVMSQVELRNYVLVTIIIPIIFWLIDSWWLFLYRENSYRFKKISQFINSDDLLESYRQYKLSNFIIFDRSFDKYKNTREYQKFVNFKRVFLFREMILLYGGLIILSLVIGLIVSRVF